MNYTVEGKSVVATERGNYKGELKCLSESDADRAADELRASDGTPESDSDVAARYNGEWVY